MRFVVLVQLQVVLTVLLLKFVYFDFYYENQMS